MTREARRTAIQQLQAERAGTTVIAYVTSTRPNFESPMAMDVIPIIYKHLELITTPPEETRIDLFLSSNGGDGVVPWKLVTLVREFCSEFNILIPHRAFSAATLACLGADEVVMHPMGMLGPTDPTVTNEFNPPSPRTPGQLLGISVEDVASYIALVKEDVGIRHEDELIQAFSVLADKVHPLALGNVKRHTLQSQMMGAKLLKSRNKQGDGQSDLADHEVEEIIRKLTSELFFHGHPINRREARDDIGLTFVKDATPAVRDQMWALYQGYVQDNKLDEGFFPIQEAIAKNPLAVPVPQPGGMPSMPNVAVVPLDQIRSVSVESQLRSDVYVLDYETVLHRDATGAYNGQIGVLGQRWLTEDGPQVATP